MDRLAVGRHVLSPMPELLSTWMEAEDALPLLRFVNEQLLPSYQVAYTTHSPYMIEPAHLDEQPREAQGGIGVPGRP